MYALVRSLVLRFKESVAAADVYLNGSLVDAFRRDQLLVLPKPIIRDARQHGRRRAHPTVVAGAVVGAHAHLFTRSRLQTLMESERVNGRTSCGLQEHAGANAPLTLAADLRAATRPQRLVVRVR
jgi:hypothetical protein